MTLSATLIAREIPLPGLADLLPDSEIENDIELLLDWLQPNSFDAEVSPPTPRIRVAARRCLNDPAGLLHFVRLWLNAIRPHLEARLAPLAASAPLAAVVDLAARLHRRYLAQAAHLPLLARAAQFFSRALAGMYTHYLSLPRIEKEISVCLSQELDAELVRTLSRLGLATSVRAAMVAVCVSRVREQADYMCARRWNKPVLGALEDWAREFARGASPPFALPKTSHVAAGGAASPAEAFSFVEDDVERTLLSGFDWIDLDQSHINQSAVFTNELARIAQNELLALRTREIYDIVAAYPESSAALAELHTCLDGAGAASRSNLVDTFVSACMVRLLHLGSTTDAVILAYMRTIRAFLVMDTSGVLLDKVARPLRRYLRLRMDLVPKLALGMLDSKSSNPLAELAHELSTTNPSPPELDDLSDIAWVPDPIDALPDFQKGKAADVLDAIVSVLPLSTMLIEELTRVLGDRLLNWKEYDSGDVVHNVELLKARFGSAEFATLDVMVRDMVESSALNMAVSCPPLRLAVLSKLYWPNVGDGDTSTLSVPVQGVFELYNKRYASTRKGRSLALIPEYGTVTLDLVFAHGKRTFTVTPTQATVINQFDGFNVEKKLFEVANAIGLSEYATLNALAFWVQQGILEKHDESYHTVENS